MEGGQQTSQSGREEDRLPPTSLRFKSPASHTETSKSDTTSSKNSDKLKKTILFSEAVKRPTHGKEAKVPVKLVQAVVTFNIRVLKGTDPKKEFNKQMALAVKTIREHLDDKAGFIPLEGEITKDTKTIRSVQDMPALIMGQKKYFDIPNPGAFNSLSQGSRMIKGSAKMCFSLDPIEVLRQAGPDLRNMDCGLYYKKLQVVKTVAEIVLLGVPMSMNEEEVEKTVTAELKKIDKGDSYAGHWDVDYKISKEYAPGMPWENEEDKKNRSQGSSAAKQAYLFTVSKVHANKIEQLLRTAKEIKVWKKHWGSTAYTVMVPGFSTSLEVKTRYQQMVNVHGSIQLSTGHANLAGIIDLTTQHKLPRCPGADGPRDPTSLSVLDCLMMMTVGTEGKKMLICAVNTPQGVVGYFPSSDQEIRDHIPKVADSIAPQLFFWLRKRGCTAEGINRMFKKCFSLEQLQKITRSKYAHGIAVMTDNDCDDIIEAAKQAGVDLNLGLSATQLREKKMEREFMASAITFGQAVPGGFESHNFADELSLTTLDLNKTASGHSVAENTMAKSMFSIASSTGNGSKDDSDDDDEGDEDAASNRYTIEGMDLVQTQGKTTDSNEEADEGSSNRSETEGSHSSYSREGSSAVSSIKGRVSIQGGLKLRTRSNIANLLLAQMANSQAEQDTDPEDTFEDAYKEEEKKVTQDSLQEGDSDDSLYSNTSMSVDSDIKFNVDNEELATELRDLMEMNNIADGRYQDDQGSFRIRLNPENFQEQLMNEAGPHVDGMIKRVELIKKALEDERDGGRLRDPAICTEKLMAHLHTESVSGGIADLLDQILINQDVLEKVRRQDIIQMTSNSLNCQEIRNDAIGEPTTNQARKTQGADSEQEDAILSRAQNG